jgi:hypothetical protein
MFRMVAGLGALTVLSALVAPAWAGDKDAAAVIEKAGKAHFPKGLDKKDQAIRTKTKGKLQIMGLGELDFTQEVSAHSGKFKEVMDLTIANKNINVVSVYNGKKAWIRSDGKDVDVTEDILNEFKDAAYSMNLMQGIFINDKMLKFRLLGEVKVKGKEAIGVTITRDGKKDINMFFDKKTGLISKVEMRKRDFMSGQEITEERYITEYMDVGGRMVAKKVEVQRDGKDFLSAEVLDIQYFEKLDDTEFAQPK